MLLHLLVAAALVAPGQNVETAVRQTAAMVCSLAVEARQNEPVVRPSAASHRWMPAPIVDATVRDAVSLLTIQLRR